MIDLTPIDIRKKKGDFKRAVRGYDTELVDDFLELVAERLEELVKQNMSLTDRLARIEEQVGEYRQRDRALTEALVTAQEVREEVRRQAEKEAALSQREAEADAQKIRADAAQAREREEENIRRLRARRMQIVESYRAFLQRELTELNVAAGELDMELREPTAPEGLEMPLAAVKPPEAAAAPPRAQASGQPGQDGSAEGAAGPDEQPNVTPSERSTPSERAEPSEAPTRPSPMPKTSRVPAEEAPPAREAQEQATGVEEEEDGPDWLASIMDEGKR